MKKTTLINTILREAIAEFAERGYGGASLRTIAMKSDTPLSSINAYFGNKTNLYQAAENYVWGVISAERNALLRKMIGKSKIPELSICDLVFCLAQPIVSRALSVDPAMLAEIHFIKERANEHATYGMGSLVAVLNSFIKPWIDELVRLCPTLTRSECVWAFSYCVGAIYSYQLIDQRYISLVEDEEVRTIDEITLEIACFCEGGVKALVTLKAKRNS